MFREIVDACLTDINVPGYHRMPWHDPLKSVRWSRLIAMDRYEKVRDKADLLFRSLEQLDVYFPTVTEWGGSGTLKLQWKDDEGTKSIVFYLSPGSETIMFSAGRVGQITENKPAGQLDVLLKGLATWLNPPRPTVPLTQQERERGKPIDCSERRNSSQRFRGRDGGGPLKRSG